MDTYLDEYVLAHLECRLVPPDIRYPDCRCVARLTESRLYISEDNFDGTYIDHIIIPILDVLCIERLALVFSKAGEEQITIEPQGWRRIVYHLFGPIVTARRNPASVQSAREYVRVLYRTADGKEAFLYLSEAGSPRRLSRELQKHRERWSLNL